MPTRSDARRLHVAALISLFALAGCSGGRGPGIPEDFDPSQYQNISPAEGSEVQETRPRNPRGPMVGGEMPAETE